MIALVLAIVLAAIAIGLLIVRQRSLVKELNDLNKRLGERASSRPADARIQFRAAVAAGDVQGKTGQRLNLFQALGQPQQIVHDFRRRRVVDALALRGLGMDQLFQ